MISLDDIRRVLILGAGTMGQQIGLQCALHGYEVTLYDVDEGALATAVSRIDGYLAQFQHTGRLNEEQIAAVRQRLTTQTDPAAAAENADLVSESVPEDPVLKGQVLAQFHDLCPPRTIFTTNTSTLLPSMFAEATKRPSQFCALHFHLPVWDSNVADIMPHPGTDPQVVTLLEGFARRIGQIPITLQKEQSGYVFNTMLSALLSSSMSLVVKGVAAPEDVDRAWMGVMGTAIGPFGIQDAIGLDTVWKISDYWGRVLNDPQGQANAALLKTYLDQGHAGVKTGQGFYKYPHPAYQEPGFLEGKS